MARISFTILDQDAKEDGDAFMSVNKILDGNSNLSKLLKSLKISYAS